jgi:hypothetical protein
MLLTAAMMELEYKEYLKRSYEARKKMYEKIVLEWVNAKLINNMQDKIQFLIITRELFQKEFNCNYVYANYFFDRLKEDAEAVGYKVICQKRNYEEYISEYKIIWGYNND